VPGVDRAVKAANQNTPQPPMIADLGDPSPINLQDALRQSPCANNCHREQIACRLKGKIHSTGHLADWRLVAAGDSLFTKSGQ